MNQFSFKVNSLYSFFCKEDELFFKKNFLQGINSYIDFLEKILSEEGFKISINIFIVLAILSQVIFLLITFSLSEIQLVVEFFSWSTVIKYSILI